jgi:hypothetical protein
MDIGNKCLIIIGMHRSGTSLTTSILQKAGLNIGSELLGAGEGNIKGHFENCDFFNFHRKVFHSYSMNTDGWELKRMNNLNEPLEAEASEIIEKNKVGAWGWKDPRTTLFLRFWEKKLPEANYLFIYRNPWEVVDSLYRRNSDPVIIKEPWEAFKAWNFYNREIIEMYKRHRKNSLLIQIDDIISDVPAFIQKINEQLGFSLCAKKASSIFDPSIYGISIEQSHLKSVQTAFVFPEAIDTLNELRTLTNKDKIIIEDTLLRESIVSDWQEVKVKNSIVNKLNLEIQSVREEKEYYENKTLLLETENQKLKTEMAYCENKLLFVKAEIGHRENELAWIKETKVWKMRKAFFKIKNWVYKLSL